MLLCVCFCCPQTRHAFYWCVSVKANTTLSVNLTHGLGHTRLKTWASDNHHKDLSVLCTMSLQAWNWEEEERASMEPVSSVSACQSASEYETEEYLKSRTPDWGSEYQFSSSLHSSEGQSCTFNTDVPQVVPCTLVISLAIPPTLSGFKGKVTIRKKKGLKSDSRISKPRQFYHLEYFFLPDDVEPQKIDIVVFHGLAKVFMESGVKTVRPWKEGDKIWVSWSQTLNVNMTKELLKKLNFHKITLKIWDTKDKVSKKVRYHRLKATVHLEDPETFEEVKFLVLSQKKLSPAGSDKASPVGVVLKEEKSQGHQEKAEKEKTEKEKTEKEKADKPTKSPQGIESPSKSSEEHEKLLKIEDPCTFRRTTVKTSASFGGSTMTEIKELIEKASVSSLMTVMEKQKSQIKGRDSDVKRKSLKKVKKYQSEEETAGTGRQSIFSIQLSIMPLLAGWQTVMARGSDKSVNILDCFVTLKTECPIMTEEQKQDLNPLTIKIKCASCLPSEPVSIDDLQRLCNPVYCRYQFHRTPVHETSGQPHGTHVFFQDVNVIFLGAMHFSDVKEYLEGAPMVVEVHDRDRKLEEHSWKPALFGEDPVDSYINLQGFISPKDTENNPFESQNKTWNPYGVARVNLADLLLGYKYLNLTVPIHNCEPQSANQSEESRNRKTSARCRTDVLRHSPMPTGNYLEANSLLKLRVDIAVPLNIWGMAQELDLIGTQIGRIIFVFNTRKLSLLQSLLQDITKINAKALDLESYPVQNMQQTLSAFRVRVKNQEQNLDVLTGFHLLDGKIHLLVLEGLACRGLKRLWESYQSWIHDICHNSTRLKEVIVRDLLPSSSMVKDLNLGFGIPISQEELGDAEQMARSSPPAPSEENIQRQISTLPQEIQTHQDKYLHWRNNMLLKNQARRGSLVKKNITEAYQFPKKPLKSTAAIRIPIPENNVVHNYSIQTLNSTELAKKEMFKEMAKEPKKRFTYSQNYLSAMVDPLDLKEEEKKAQKNSRQAWLTAGGFQLWGLQNTTGSHQQDLRLPPIRELNEEWQESVVLINKLKPVLDRERWSWSQRHVDFELYKKPPLYLPLPPLPAPKSATARKRKAKTQSSEQRQRSRVTLKPPGSHGSFSVQAQDSPNDPLPSLKIPSQLGPTFHESSLGLHLSSPSFPSHWLH
ncbi:uncharacterized protein CFAP92 isoform X2 [Meriones unguiculatus]|uniref:uncharacterized protein CFAP92 isoform X2 n=1 Tax=Meriones unguiculatus TaxID=10047 RepID=UPI00293EF1FB|nr:uncharacterized protein CFAP92 isoform X2 [Meriones unguiculatus]